MMAVSSCALRASDSETTIPAPACHDFALNPSAGCKLAHQGGAHRPARIYYIAKKTVYDIFIEDTQVAVSERVHFEALELQAFLIGNVSEDQLAEIRQASFWA